MADRNLNNTSDNFDPEFNEPDGNSSVPVADGFEDDTRPVINLDSVGDLASAVAAASNGGKSASAIANDQTSNVSDAQYVQMKKQLDDAQEQAKIATENHMRTLADIQNLRRRTEEERLRIVRDGNEKLIKELLPVMDDFDLALSAARTSESVDQLLSGMEAIHRKFMLTLNKQGVDPINTTGAKFDPDIHEAVMVDEDSDLPEETVSSELRKGYTLNGRVIRPSLVKVAK